MSSVKTSIFIGRCDDRDYVFALSFDQAKELVQEHFAFGDPSESGYAKSNKWATIANGKDWQIVETTVEAAIVVVDREGSEPCETTHVTWQCPMCKKFYSDEWRQHDRMPILLMCGCVSESKYLIGVLADSTDSPGD